MPPDMREWLPDDHLAWLVLEIVGSVDRSGLHARHPNAGRGRPAYDPDMLLALLIYAYCLGVRSSRQIEQRCATDVAFRVLCAQDAPDHTTIARFRAEHQDAFAALFTQVLQVAAAAGLARFGTVAIDGTKIAANASRDANRHHDWLAREVDTILAQAERVDAAEDAEQAGQRGDGGGQRLPAGLGDRSGRAQRLSAALAEVQAQQRAQQQAEQQRQASAAARLERAQAGESVVGRIPRGPHRLAEAQAHLAREVDHQQAKLDRRAAVIAAGRRPVGRPPVPVEQHPHVIRARRAVEAALAGQPTQPGQSAIATTAPTGKTAKPAKPVANTTDPQSRLMPTRSGFVQGFNAQVAVTADQVIVALQVGQSPNDLAAFVPMMHAAQAVAEHLHDRTGDPRHVIGTVLADAGYASDANLAVPGPDRLIALGKHVTRQGRPEPHPLWARRRRTPRSAR